MSDVDSERIDEIVTDVSVWIGRTAVGAMEDLYERDALLELQRLGKLAKDLLVKLAAVSDTSEQWQVRCAGCLCAAEGATSEQVTAKQGDYGWTPAYQKTLELRREFDQLRAELAAMELTRTDAVNNAVKWADESESLQQQLDSVKAELARIRNANDDDIDVEPSAKVNSFIQRLMDIAKARGLKIAELRGELAGTFDLVASTECDANSARIERDEAIGLLKWLVAYPSSKSQLENIAAYDMKMSREPAKRILELTAK